MRLIFLFLLLLPLSTPLMAQVYKCENNGATVYTDKPCDTEAKVLPLPNVPAIGKNAQTSDRTSDAPLFPSLLKTTWMFQESRKGEHALPGLSPRCLRLPVPVPSSSVSGRMLQWTIDLPVHAENHWNARDIDQMNALTEAGMLTRIAHKVQYKPSYGKPTIETDGYRYTITLQGWRYLGKDCFEYGFARFLSFNKSETISKKTLKPHLRTAAPQTLDGIRILSGTVGFASTKDLHPWAQHPEVIRAFALDKRLTESITIPFLKLEGEWISAEIADSRGARTKWKQFRDIAPRQEPWVADTTDLSTNNFPFAETITERMIKDSIGNSAWDCPLLPGESSYFRADIRGRVCSTARPYHFPIIDNDPELKPQRQAIRKTRPFAERLVKKGVLVAERSTQIAALRLNDNKLYSGTIYRPSPAYRNALNTTCGCLDKPSRYQFIDLRLPDKGSPEGGTYKVIAYYNRPSWATDDLIEKWDELRLALKYGRAFQYNTSGGSRGNVTFWAFDPPAELEFLE